MGIPSAVKILFPMTNLVDEFSNPPKPSAEVKNIDVVRALSEAVVSVSQSINQGVLTNQLVKINCDRKTAGEACLLCIKTLKDVGFSEDVISQNCKVTCTCNIEDVNMSQIINLDINDKFTTASSETFYKQFENSITAQSEQTGSSFNLFSKTELTALTTSVTNVFTKMKTSDFKNKLDQINNLQMITLKGAGEVKNITINSAVNYVSRCIMSSETMMSDITSIEKQIFTMSTQITKNYMLAIIDLIVSLIFFGMMIFVIWTFIQVIITVFTQFSSAKSLSMLKDMQAAPSPPQQPAFLPLPVYPS